MMIYGKPVLIYYHYSTGCRRRGHRVKMTDNLAGAKEWIQWMNTNMYGFVLDYIER